MMPHIAFPEPLLFHSQSLCLADELSACSPNPHIGALKPGVMVLGSGASRGNCVLMGSFQIRKGESSLLSFSHERTQIVAVFKPESSHQNPTMPAPRSRGWGFQNFEEISSCDLSHAVHDSHEHYGLVLTNLFISPF